MKMKRICVFCGSKSGLSPDYARAAVETGRLLAERGLGLVFGGGSVGLMGVLADAALAAGGEVIGVLPKPLEGREIAHRGLTEMHVVDTLHDRKGLMGDLSDAFIALPGGLGTLDELFEVLTWSQLGVHDKPCGLINVAGYYDPLLALLDAAVREGFVNPEHRALLMVEESAAPLLERFEEYYGAGPEKAAGAREG